MKTLVIDNYDSFTYNLVNLLAEVNQEMPTVVLNDQIGWAELREWRFDNIVISPGPGRSDRSTDFGVSRDAIHEAGVPLLGVCLGHQGIAAINGASVGVITMPVHGRASSVRHDGSALFEGIPSPFEAARYHSLTVGRPLPPALKETAWTTDGLVMALAHRHRLQWGVQFHPESIITEYGRRLIRNFRDATLRSMPRLVAIERSVPERAAAWREVPKEIDAEAAFVALFGDALTAFWLDSSSDDPERARWSYLGDTGGAGGLVEYETADRRLVVTDATGTRAETSSIFSYLERHSMAPSHPPPCPFKGGYVGWFGYELRNECGSPSSHRARTPDALFIRAQRYIAIDHFEKRTYVVAIDEPGSPSAAAWVEATAGRLACLAPPPAIEYGTADDVRFRLDRDRQTHLNDVERSLRWIRAGESYQICLTNEIACNVEVSPLALYRVMRRVNPAPCSAFVRWPGGAVLSGSPERFLAVDAEGRVETKPIKGTVPRGADAESDARLAMQLRCSEKDRAENTMIVDLLRNDLSRVCQPGSVVVPALCAIESFATVHQLVSTVRGRLNAGVGIVDLVRATFPGGSMTGAPKLRACEFIDKLEHRARGVYSGALGWIGDDGAADLSIVIRAIVAIGDELTIGTGGGIVIQSTPEDEFAETMLKAQAPMRAIVLAATGGYAESSYAVEGLGLGLGLAHSHGA
jgi:para-aminobenzoate synthetase